MRGYVEMKEMSTDIAGPEFLNMLNILNVHCDKFALIQRKDMISDIQLRMEYINKLIQEIREFLIGIEETSSWATNELVDGTALIYYFELNEKTINFLVSKGKSLFGWVSPLLEDLTIFQNNEVWLAVNAHERYFYLNENILEYTKLKD